jgi:alpha-beta hydrolase superfamily lysophospholipase
VAVAGFVLGLLVCFVMAVSEWGAWALVVPGRRLGAVGPGSQGGGASEPAEREPGEPIEAIAADGTRLAGLWQRAAGTERGVVLLVHGFAEIRDALRGRVGLLTQSGWSVARLEMRGYGRSGGGLASFGGREGDDLRDWIDVIAARYAPDAPPPIAAWGRSMGAAIVARAAAGEPRIAAVVLESPYDDLAAVVAGWLRKLPFLPCRRVLAALIVRRAGRLAGVSLRRPRPVDLARRIGAPALIVHGRDDSLVPPAAVARLAAAFPRPPQVVEVPGAGHSDVIDVGGPELIGRVVAFLDASVATGPVSH